MDMRELKGAEILAVGTWHGNITVNITDEILDSIVTAFGKFSQAGRVPLKLGHNKKQPVTDGQPALGWVQRVWKDGGKLLADFSDMPKLVYDTVKAGLYKFISSEVLLDVDVDGDMFPGILDAVALLGADIPAVSGLKDLQALTASRAPFPIGTGGRLVAFSRQDSNTQALGGKGKMSGENIDQDALRQLTVDQVNLKAEQERLAAEKAEFKRQQDAHAEQQRKESINRHRQDRKAQFDKAVKDKKITSAQRDTAEKLMRFSDDNSVLQVTAAEVDEAITAMAATNRGSGSRASFSQGGSRESGTGRESDLPGDELAERIAAAQADAEAKGKVWGPEDAATFARGNRQLVRGWMDSIGS